MQKLYRIDSAVKETKNISCALTTCPTPSHTVNVGGVAFSLWLGMNQSRIPPPFNPSICKGNSTRHCQ